jgi:hypothetical protein
MPSDYEDHEAGAEVVFNVDGTDKTMIVEHMFVPCGEHGDKCAVIAPEPGGPGTHVNHAQWRAKKV